MAKNKVLDPLAKFLLFTGGVVHGINAFGINLVDQLASVTNPLVGPVVYGLVGASTVYLIVKSMNR